ncbi:hypothetical protein F751_4173 [Auxenochlorella protothecoides]|uniref:Uncharacterized protein n=1 Tax=Auxenochlorella protothecoides TaxID=3075 RepID=A0A087SJL7_AUXPR|nr:hypothetical protein F751_4173 [Auxenochlorella protothecoides]KFM25921.1 hypothetical protein F751_4173 [Auxenochlorella protothecoides]
MMDSRGAHPCRAAERSIGLGIVPTTGSATTGARGTGASGATATTGGGTMGTTTTTSARGVGAPGGRGAAPSTDPPRPPANLTCTPVYVSRRLRHPPPRHATFPPNN